MKQVNWDGKELLPVELPHDAESLTLHIHPEDDYFVLGYELQNNDEESGFYGEWVEYDIDLPKQVWQFAFASPLLPTEEEARGWVDSFPYLELFKDYMALENGYEYDLDNPVESLHSRIRSEGFDPNRTVLLVKKPKT